MPISIFPLFLLMGVASSFPWDSPWRLHDDDTVFRPIMGRSNERRICVELCSSGLGGESCGEDCEDLSPFVVPIQSTSLVPSAQNNNKVVAGSPRNESCPLLCEFNLGKPLCDCSNIEVKTKNVNFVEICANFCIRYDYQIYGCQSCNIYKHVFQNEDQSSSKVEKNNPGLKLYSVKLDPQWIQWCVNKCSVGEGGSACNCDKPVMAI